MKPLKELYLDLKKFSDFDAVSENAEAFLNTVDEIVLRKDPSSIPVLLDYFDDKSDYSWVMTSIRKSIEFYKREEYISAILKNLNLLCENAICWTDEIVNSILNDVEDNKYFRTHMHLADLEALLKLFKLMEKESSHHTQLIQELRTELMQSAK